jgi:purine-nucleoside phosphorylase
VLKLLGAKTVLLTNAAGAVNQSYQPGDIMVVCDHIKLNGASPLRGGNVEEFGPRFFDVSSMYTPQLRKLALSCAEDSGLVVHEGVYMFFPGPQFETPAEIRAARILGADAVGMSTVTEALTAAHCGMPLLCLSVMTNMAAGVLDHPLTDEEVDETGKLIAARFSSYVTKIISRI